RIAYWDAAAKNLKFASKNGGAWSIETVDAGPDVGQYAALTLFNDAPRVSYFDAATGDLKYADRSGGSWAIETVDTTGVVGEFTSIAVDPLGVPHISYYDATTPNRLNLRYAVKTPLGWATPVIDAVDNIGLFTSIAIAASDTLPRIAYYDATNG